MSRTTTQLPTVDGKSITAITVDRRAEYQAKVLNRGDKHHPNHWLRRAFEQRIQTGRMVLTAVQGIALNRAKQYSRASLQRLDWKPTLPRIDAPPPIRKHA